MVPTEFNVTAKLDGMAKPKQGRTREKYVQESKMDPQVTLSSTQHVYCHKYLKHQVSKHPSPRHQQSTINNNQQSSYNQHVINNEIFIVSLMLLGAFSATQYGRSRQNGRTERGSDHSQIYGLCMTPAPSLFSRFTVMATQCHALLIAANLTASQSIKNNVRRLNYCSAGLTRGCSAE